MSIITLTTDLGLMDYYVASLKGAILSECPAAMIVDITHDVDKHDISKAAFILKNAYGYFPEKSIHIISVNSGSSRNSPHLVFYEDNHYFIGPDNGLFPLIFNAVPKELFTVAAIRASGYPAFPAREIYARIACHIAKGGGMAETGARAGKWIEKTLLQPIIEPHRIKGFVVYIDSYGNAITNITKRQFEEIGAGKKFSVFFRKTEYEVTEISDDYSRVPEGEKLAMFNAGGYLEIAINKGPASSLLGLYPGDVVRVEFDNNS